MAILLHTSTPLPVVGHRVNCQHVCIRRTVIKSNSLVTAATVSDAPVMPCSGVCQSNFGVRGYSDIGGGGGGV